MYVGLDTERDIYKLDANNTKGGGDNTYYGMTSSFALFPSSVLMLVDVRKNKKTWIIGANFVS